MVSAAVCMVRCALWKSPSDCNGTVDDGMKMGAVQTSVTTGEK